jgi:hypothetical protein
MSILTGALGDPAGQTGSGAWFPAELKRATSTLCPVGNTGREFCLAQILRTGCLSIRLYVHANP